TPVGSYVARVARHRRGARALWGVDSDKEKNEGHLRGTGGTPLQMAFTDSRSTWGEVNAAGRLCCAFEHLACQRSRGIRTRSRNGRRGFFAISVRSALFVTRWNHANLSRGTNTTVVV